MITGTWLEVEIKSEQGGKDEPASNSVILSPTGQQETPGGGDLTNMFNSLVTLERRTGVNAMFIE